MKKIIYSFIFLSISLFSQTIDIDKNNLKVDLKNNSVNLLKFPFVITSAGATTETPDNFTITSKNQTVTIIPAVDNPEIEWADLVIWSDTGDPYLIKVTADGNNTQIFTFASNTPSKAKSLKAARYETGKIESDIKKIMKKMALGEAIPGYSKVDVKKMFKTPDLNMQKEFFYDGGKYRAEQWFIQNTSNDIIFLDYENFYTSGILSIAFEKRTLKPNQITKAWFVVDKNTIFENIRNQ